MSNPPNILSSFRTYAYHHVLIACDSTSTALELAKSSEIVIMSHPSDHTQDLFPSRKIGNGEYVVLINGMTDTQFVINKVKFATVFAPNSATNDGQSYADTMEIDGEMEIQEPRGIRFLNVLANVCDTLRTDPSGLVFVLKTIFVGEKADSSIEMIPNIRPMMFTMIDVTAVIDEGGAIYTLSTIGVNNGAAKLPQVSRIAGGFSMKLVKQTNDEQDRRLKSVLEHAMSIIDNHWLTFRDNLQKQAKQQGYKNINFEKDFRRVSYRIKVDDLYDDSYIAGDNEKITQHDKEGQPIAQFGKDIGVEEILRGIMASCLKVQQDAKGTDEGRFIYKITSSIQSTVDEYVVEYQVNKYQMVTNPFDPTEKGFEPAPGEFIEFDYLFTGKNTDIINFDIKMEMGLAFFQTVVTTNSISDQKGTPEATGQGKGGGQSAASASLKARPLTPLFLGTKLNDATIRNKQNPIDTMTFNAMMARHAAYENIGVQMTILGNPQLLDELLLLPNEMAKQITEVPKEGKTINPSWLKTPSLAKVNIMMPTNDRDEDFAQKFWYQGYYIILSVNNIFDQGLFTQELELISLPVTNELTDVNSDNPDVDVSTTPPREAASAFEDISTERQTNTNERTVKNKMANLNSKREKA